MNIRLLKTEDWLAYKTIRLEALKNHPEAYGSSFEEESNLSDEQFAASFKNCDMYGCFVDNELVGITGFFVCSQLKMQHRGVLFAMYIKPDYRKMGIADVLVKTIIQHAQKRVNQLHLTVVTTNQVALNLYEKNGFRVYGTEPRALKVGDHFYDEHMMVREFRATAS